jgi:hypothetical protein
MCLSLFTLKSDHHKKKYIALYKITKSDTRRHIGAMTATGRDAPLAKVCESRQIEIFVVKTI